MKINWLILAGTALIGLALMSGAAIFAQTEVPTAPVSSFTDGRINGDIDLGGLGIYCTDQTGSTHVNTFQNGGIEVWGVGGQKYITLTAAQLRGSVEIPQPPATMEANMTEMPTMEAMPGATAEATVSAPVLLAQAVTPNGEVWFIGLGRDQFELQGTDNTGKFFSYSWTGCGMGSIQAGAVPLFTPAPSSGEESTEMPTAEMTASS